MRVGILTFQRSHSHGAFLQAHALMTHLRATGHDVQIIDYFPQHRKNTLALGNYKWSRRHCGLTMANLAWLRQQLWFRYQLPKLLPLTPRRYSSLEDLRAHPPEIDACIVGSDQVWNYELTGGDYDEAYFCNFGPEQMLRVSYAASFGRAEVPEHIEKLGTCLQLLDRVSVREQSGVSLVGQNSSHVAARVLDPTLLVDANAYPVPPCQPSKGEYVLAYFLQRNDATDAILNRVTQTMGLPAISVHTAFRVCGRPLGQANPVEFLRLVKGARYVVTNSFHGLALSIGHRTDFTCMGLTGSASAKSTRLKELLSELGLRDRFVSFAEAAADTKVAADPVDWTTCEARLRKLRRESVEYLRGALQPGDGE